MIRKAEVRGLNRMVWVKVRESDLDVLDQLLVLLQDFAYEGKPKHAREIQRRLDTSVVQADQVVMTPKQRKGKGRV